MRIKTKSLLTLLVLAICTIVSSTVATGQSVCLPAPRLLTTMPMGGQAGETLDVTITGEWIDGADQLMFSNQGISAKPKLDSSGQPIPNQYTVTIAKDCPVGIHEARVMTRLGLSASRAFSVSNVPEKSQASPSTSPGTAFPISVNSVCNATMPVRAVNHYSFTAKKGQRLLVECAAGGIDSKLKPVVIVADEKGRDLKVERRGGMIEFITPSDGTYMVKTHDLTFNGGNYYFYRLAVRELSPDERAIPSPSTRNVNAFSWPPVGLARTAATTEADLENGQAQSITLPADIAGSFYPAADVDTYEFDAKAGESWWVEVASERFGLPTDPSVVVQQINTVDGEAKYTDIAELSDIPSPVKVSSNGYAYDGPPYNAGSSDVLGKFEIKTDGRYRLQLRDRFGGTRNDPKNRYRMVVRKAKPDFALVGWALHMMLRNGDRNALSKPIALRRGASMALEIIAIRRDGFDGPIELNLEDLPEGVTATGLTIPAKQSRGIVVVTADANAPRGLSLATFSGTATINEESVTRPCTLASMKWPVKDGKSEIPAPRLLADVPVSVGGVDLAPITIAPSEDKIWEAKEGEKLTVELVIDRREEFSGANVSLSTVGAGCERNPKFDVPLSAKKSQATLDLARTKTPPGDYSIAFYGGAVVKYKHNPDAVMLADSLVKKFDQDVRRLTEEAKRLASNVKAATSESKAELEKKASEAAAAQKAAATKLAAAKKQLQKATAAAKSKDIAEIIVTEPVKIRVLPKDK